MTSPREEAERIINILFDEFSSFGIIPQPLPLFIDEKRAINWLEENYFSYKRFEWPGFFIKHYIRFLLDKFVPGEFEKFNPVPRLHLVKGRYSWDIRLRALKSQNPWVPLVDQVFLDEYLNSNEGYGLLVAVSHAEKDEFDKFLKWHEEFKGGLSSYTKKRIKEGRPGRIRKSSFYIISVYAYFLTKDIISQGIAEKWVDPSFQKSMRQQDGSERNPKYSININNLLTTEAHLGSWNFNEEPDSFVDPYYFEEDD